MKILLLEDDFSLSNTLKEILELEGYEVDIANNANEVLISIFEKVICFLSVSCLVVSF